jgi:hypothetical protein
LKELPVLLQRVGRIKSELAVINHAFDRVGRLQ